MAGVGRTPALRASPPPAEKPAANALSRARPLSRVSRAIRSRGRGLPTAKYKAAAFPKLKKVPGVTGSTPALPRMPSVPNRCRFKNPKPPYSRRPNRGYHAHRLDRFLHVMDAQHRRALPNRDRASGKRARQAFLDGQAADKRSHETFA